MTPVIPCSVSNITIFTRVSFSPRKEIRVTKWGVPGGPTRPTLSSQRFVLPRSLSLRLFQKYSSGCNSKYRSRIQIVAAVGTDVATEEPNPAIFDEDADKTSENPTASPGTNETSSADPATVTPTAQSKRTRPVRKSEMPPVKNEELVPGASFTGKVRSIQPFGAFVDFGAFSDGLVHVSKMSDEFVKDVGSVVSVGQEVKVRIVDANMETGRISLTMRESDDENKLQQQKDAAASGNMDKLRTIRKTAARSNQRREVVQKSSKFVKGQVLDGTVKNLTRSGAFVSLPEGEEGFLPTSEESEGFSILGSSSLQVGQEVNVRVLRITRGQVTLTMKKEEDIEGLNKKLNQGVVYTATNPFELAFRKNKDIAAFLEERDRLQESAEKLSRSNTSEQIEEKVDETKSDSDALEVEDSTVSTDRDMVSAPSASDVEIEDDRNSSEEQSKEAVVVDSISSEVSSIDEKPESTFSGSSQNVDSALETLSEEEKSSETSISEEGASSADSAINKAYVTDEMKGPSAETVEEDDTGSETLISEEAGSAANLVTDEPLTIDGEKENGSAIESIKEQEASSNTSISEGNGSAADSMTDEASDISSGTEPSKPGNKAPLVDNETIPVASEDVTVAASSNPEKNDNSSSNGQTGVPTQEGSIKATVSPALVKQLREETGAGMMDCKKALAETGGDIVNAQEFLRKKGLASADKKASRATAEGRIGSYIHDNRIGVLIEVNCETDFVSRGDIFKELVDDLAMQVAACPQVQYLVTEDVPEEIVNKEREIEMQKEDLLTKPEQIRSKIVDGRIRKRLEEFALLEQPYIKNDKTVVKDWVKQMIATIGENIKVKRFVRYNLGEGLEKKSQDFAAEVGSQTAAKPSAAVQMDSPAEAKETAEKPPTVTVSAALVKQLRGDTGAGMMDCKKALTETGGDLEKAQEYLRKKGLSSADKKSSRLAAEGRISSYIYDSRIGVLIEVNCETDFVGRNEKFRELVDDLAMQVVACPQVHFVSVEEIPESIVSKEREIEVQREDLKSKPENIREKIVDGRISKRLGELALLEQPFIKDDSVLVKDLVKQTVAALGENIRVRRFVRFTLGE